MTRLLDGYGDPLRAPRMGQGARERCAAARRRHRAARNAQAPADAAPIPGHLDYGVTPAGEVWRLTPTHNRPEPHKITPVWVGSAAHRYPCVRLYGAKVVTRTISALVREVYPDRGLIIAETDASVRPTAAASGSDPEEE